VCVRIQKHWATKKWLCRVYTYTGYYITGHSFVVASKNTTISHSQTWWISASESDQQLAYMIWYASSLIQPSSLCIITVFTKLVVLFKIWTRIKLWTWTYFYQEKHTTMQCKVRMNHLYLIINVYTNIIFYKMVIQIWKREYKHNKSMIVSYSKSCRKIIIQMLHPSHNTWHS